MRIIAGRYQRRKLRTPRGMATRPILDRVKQALFDALGSRYAEPGRLPRMNVLDLYCGGGTLGIEALSRGAAWCVFVDNAPDALRCLRANLAAAGIGSAAAIVTGPAESAAIPAPPRPSTCPDIRPATVEPFTHASARPATISEQSSDSAFRAATVRERSTHDANPSNPDSAIIASRPSVEKCNRPAAPPPRRAYDLIFLDPPFPLSAAIVSTHGSQGLVHVFARLGRDVPLAPGALCIWRFESGTRVPESPAPGWHTLTRRRYGRSTLSWLTRDANAA